MVFPCIGELCHLFFVCHPPVDQLALYLVMALKNCLDFLSLLASAFESRTIRMVK